MTAARAFALLGALLAIASPDRAARAGEPAPEFAPADPLAEFLPAAPGEPSVDFCARWNPEFGYRGFRCCSNAAPRAAVATSRRGRRRRVDSCAPNRQKSTFCDEMTPEQRDYVRKVKSGKVDPLESILHGVGSRGGQSFCGASNGFLVEGRPIVASEKNRIEIRNEARCSNFGTDPLVGAIEWVGREIKKEFHEPRFSRARLIMGDASAPRGGCVAGRGGRRAHKSHTSGVDIDVTFFNPRADHPPEERFTRNFYVASNWWFVKKIFKNPFACIKIIFTDQKNIRMLGRYAKNDPEWSKLSKYIRHVRGHRDHFHIRVGSGPGVPGCASDPNLEEDEDGGDELESPASALAANDAEPETDPADDLAAEESLRAPAGDALAAVAAGPNAIPDYKLEPAITAKYVEKGGRGRGRRKVARRILSKK